MPGASATWALLGSQSSFSHRVPLAASAEPAAVADKPKAASESARGDAVRHILLRETQWQASGPSC